MVWSGFTFHYRTCLRVQRKGFHSTQKTILRNHILPMFRANTKLQGICSQQAMMRPHKARFATYLPKHPRTAIAFRFNRRVTY